MQTAADLPCSSEGSGGQVHRLTATRGCFGPRLIRRSAPGAQHCWLAGQGNSQAVVPPLLTLMASSLMWAWFADPRTQGCQSRRLDQVWHHQGAHLTARCS